MKINPKKRFRVCRSDESGTLFRSDGTPADHTWDVVDMLVLVDDHGVTVSNYDTRAQARNDARSRNAATAAP